MTARGFAPITLGLASALLILLMLRDAEQRLQVLLAKEQQKVADRFNWFTFFLIGVGLLNIAVLAFQVWGK